MPIVWISHFILISIPLSLGLYYFIPEIDFKQLAIPKFIGNLLNLLFDIMIAPGTMVHEKISNNFLCMGVLVSLIPSFYLSCFIESCFYKDSTLNKLKVKEGVKKANLMSYLFMGICTIFLWYYDLYFFGERSKVEPWPRW